MFETQFGIVYFLTFVGQLIMLGWIMFEIFKMFECDINWVHSYAALFAIRLCVAELILQDVGHSIIFVMCFRVSCVLNLFKF